MSASAYYLIQLELLREAMRRGQLVLNPWQYNQVCRLIRSGLTAEAAIAQIVNN